MMKLSRFSIACSVVVALLFAISLYRWSTREKMAVADDSQNTKTEVTETAGPSSREPGPRLIELSLSAPPESLEVKIPEASDQVPSLCVQEQRELLRWGAPGFADRLENGSVRITPTCWVRQKGLSPKPCFGLNDNRHRPKLCQAYLLAAHSVLIREFAQPLRDLREMPESVLATHIVALLRDQGELKSQERLRLRGLAAELMRRSPENFEAMKAYLASFLDGKKLAQLEREPEFVETLAKARVLRPDDSQVLELYFALRLHSAKGRAEIRELAPQLQDRSLGLLYLAHLDWLEGHAKSALETLRQAAALEPHNLRIKLTLKRLELEGYAKGDALVEHRIGFSFDSM